MFFTNWPSYSDLLSGSLIGSEFVPQEGGLCHQDSSSSRLLF